MSSYTSWRRTHDTSYNSNTVSFRDHIVADLKVQSVPPKTKGAWITLPNGSKFRRATNYDRWSRVTEPQFPQFGIGKWYEVSRHKWHDLVVETSPGGWHFDYATASQLYSAWTMSDIGLNGISGLNMSPNIPAASENEAVVKALNELADMKANVGENLGTLGQTLRLVCNPARALASSMQSVYRNKSLRPLIRESLNSLKHKGIHTRAAEKYLEYVYGWKPLMQDIHGLIGMAQAKGDLPLLLAGKGKSTHTQAPKGGTYGEPSFKSKTTISGGSFTSTVRCKLYARLDPDHTGLRVLNQLGLANPLALAWELVSWSFVLDWFVPVGPALQALSAPAGLIFVDGSVSNRVTGTGAYTNRYYGVDDKITSSDATGVIHYEGYRRKTITSWPKVGFWVDPDPFRGDRLLKATALMIANIKTLD